MHYLHRVHCALTAVMYTLYNVTAINGCSSQWTKITTTKSSSRTCVYGKNVRKKALYERQLKDYTH